MKDLHSILKAVSRGKMDVNRAEHLIQELFEAAQGDTRLAGSKREVQGTEEKSRQRVSAAKSSVDAALARLGSRVGIDSLVKKSREFGRKVEFRPSHAGFEARLSIFSQIECAADSDAEGNTVSGSQWSNVRFADLAEVRKNNFTLSQISNVICSRSNFSSNELGLARLSDVSIVESRFENNRLSRSQCTDVSIAESDFTHNRLLRSDFVGVVLNASRLANVVMNGTHWHECEFDQSDIQGLKFEGCHFEECRFVNCELVSEGSELLTGLRVKGKTFEGVRSLEDWLKALEFKPTRDHNPRHPASQRRGRASFRGAKGHREKN